MTFQLSDGFNSRDCLFLDFTQRLQSSLILHLLLIHVITRFFFIPMCGYFITFELFSSPMGREFDQKIAKKKIQMPHLCPYSPPHPSPSKY